VHTSRNSFKFQTPTEAAVTSARLRRNVAFPSLESTHICETTTSLNTAEDLDDAAAGTLCLCRMYHLLKVYVSEFSENRSL